MATDANGSRSQQKKACFDNPIFQESGGTSEDHVSNKYPEKDYKYSTGPGQTTTVYFRKTNQRHKHLRIFAVVAIAVLLIALIIALLAVYLGKSNEDYQTVVLFRTNKISGRLRIIQGPFSVYTDSLRNPKSDAYKYFSRSFIYKVKDAFHASDYSSSYNSTIIKSFSPGVIVDFTISFKTSIDITPSTADSIKQLIIKELDGSVFYIDRTQLEITPIESLRPPSTISPGKCQPISLTQCVNQTDYHLTSFPNFAGHGSLQVLQNNLNDFLPFFNQPCYAYSTTFFCSVLTPECRHGRNIPPCRQFCKDVKDSCVNTTFPVNCDILPDSEDSSVCTPNPYKPAKCFEYKNKTLERCANMGFKMTAFPNYAGDISEMDASSLVNLVTSLQDATNCYTHADLFACSAFVPKCSGTELLGQHTIPPCRSICEATRAGCEVFMDIFGMPWPSILNCSSFPDVNDTSVCIGYTEANEPRSIQDCPIGHLRCDTDVCIPPSWVCDGFQDCADMADEQYCAKCPTGQQRCVPASGLCIDTSAICDGTEDCFGNVDEFDCVQLGTTGTNSGILMIKDGISTHWQEVCSDNWMPDLNIKVCNQLGYNSVGSYSEVNATNNNMLKAIFNYLRNGTNDQVIQSYLEKSIGNCQDGTVVHLTCENPVCGNRPGYFSSQLRIVNGEEVTPGTWPTQVSLHGGENEAYYCGASLVGHRWVLTAGHCVGGKTTGDGITLKLGASRRETYSEYRQIRKAKNVFVHHEYSPMTVDNDIALIELDSPVNFNNYLRPICLPGYNEGTPVNTRCYAVGWGRRDETAKDYERALKAVNLDIVDWDSCEKDIEDSPVKSAYKLTKNMMCAGGSLNHDACQGDSGGPLLCPKNTTLNTWYIAGVVSWGIGCAVPNVPGVYTNVSHYVEWIRNITNGEISSE